jgi:glycosyltransferase involved in cell wall biosynthesis
MILFIFNGYFPDNTGFGLRCKREIDAISKSQQVVVICRKKPGAIEKSEYITPFGKKIGLNRFSSSRPLIETPKKYIPIIYELLRNTVILIKLSIVLIRQHIINRHNEIKIFSTASPLIIPLMCLIISKIFRSVAEVVDIHDLEPELAKHIKKLSENSIIMKIEYIIERLVCRSFKKVIVTTEGQKNKLMQRTGKSANMILSLPNTIDIRDYNFTNTNRDKYRKLFGLKDSDFVVGYVSNITYDYTYDGLLEIINKITVIKAIIPNIKFIIAGDGQGIFNLKESIKKHLAENYFILLGRIVPIENVLTVCDVGIVPWKKTFMTETMLPTKLFEYMLAKIPVIVSNFGELSKLMDEAKCGFTYCNNKQLTNTLSTLNSNREICRNFGEKGFKYIQIFNSEYYYNNIYVEFLKL